MEIENIKYELIELDMKLEESYLEKTKDCIKEENIDELRILTEREKIYNKKKCVPFVEKFRPQNFKDIVLNPINKKILQNIIDTSYFPNLLFYGPPGTGKTSTVINLINSYQKKLNQNNKELVIHLNASDDRGIDIIRNQIYHFVSSNSIFVNGLKFVILDEADYMTKNAQQALKCLLQNYYQNVRFCLICNYISKIDDLLKNEFMCIRFEQMDKNDIYKFLNNINVCENLGLNKETIYLIQKKYSYDIRSMVNFMQSNQHLKNIEFFIESIVFENIYQMLIDIKKEKENEPHFECNNLQEVNALQKVNEYIKSCSYKYNIDKKCIIKDFINYLIKNKDYLVSIQLLNKINIIIHMNDCKNDYFINYILLNLIEVI